MRLDSPTLATHHPGTGFGGRSSGGLGFRQGSGSHTSYRRPSSSTNLWGRGSARVGAGCSARSRKRARGPTMHRMCLPSQAPALQQYRTSAGSPANQSPTSPVSNQGFSPGSSPQVRDTTPPLHPALQPCFVPLCAPAWLPAIWASCLTPSHFLHPPGWGWGGRGKERRCPSRPSQEPPCPSCTCLTAPAGSGGPLAHTSDLSFGRTPACASGHILSGLSSRPYLCPPTACPSLDLQGSQKWMCPPTTALGHS